MTKSSIYNRFVKRAMDLGSGGMGIVALLPITAVIAAAIRLESKGPILYRQERIGVNGRPFEMLKFRSMLRLEDSYDSSGEPLENYDRVTKIGRLLRASSLDELPQLINVVRGEMSLVGPRPTLRYQVERYDARQHGRLSVRPGLTGLAQVSGRNSLSWDEKIDFDLQYVRRLSFGLDLKILVRTTAVIVRQESVAFRKHDSLSHHHGDYRKNI